MKSQKAIKGIDVAGNIAILKFPKKTPLKEKTKIAKKILKQNKSISTVLEKTGKFKGRLRKQATKYLFGVKTKEALYRENGCTFRFNVDTCYFSPRLSGERKEIAGKIRKNDEVLVMFSGVNPFGIAIAKNSKAKKIYSNEINKEANKYALLNSELNKVKDRVILLRGNVKSVTNKIKNGLSINNETVPKKFDVIVMPRPKLKDSFLKEAFSLSKKGTRIFYYDFCKDDEIKLIADKIKTQSKRSRKNIKILNVKKAGEIAPYTFRIRVDFAVL